MEKYYKDLMDPTPVPWSQLVVACHAAPDTTWEDWERAYTAAYAVAEHGGRGPCWAACGMGRAEPEPDDVLVLVRFW